MMLMLGAVSMPAAAADHLRLANTPDEPSHILAQQILELAYARAGLEVTFVNMPFLRSLSQSNSGHLDGEVARLAVIETDYSNLIRVPVELFHISAYAYALKPIPEVKSWQDLKGKKLGLELGVVFIDHATRGFPRVFASSKRDMAMMLKRGAVDYVVHSGLISFGEPEFKFYQSAPLQTENIYHYLHRKNARFIPPLTKALQALKDEGVLDQLYQEATR